MTPEEFLTKYGTDGPEAIVGAYIFKAPPFTGDKELATKIGELIGDLKTMLVEVDAQMWRDAVLT